MPRFEATLHWQRELLRVLLRVAGIMALLACLLEIAFLRQARPFVAPVAIVGILLLCVSLSRLRNSRAMSAGFVTIVFATLAYLGASQAWVPSVTAALCLLLVTAALLLGRGAALWITASSAILLAVGGLAAVGGLYAPSLSAELVPTRGLNWLRVGAAFVILAAGAIVILSYAIRTLEQAESDGARSYEALKRELELLDRTRAERIDREITLRGAQKLATVAQLGNGFAHLFNNVLTVVRSSLDEVRASGPGPERRTAIETMTRVGGAAAIRIRDLLLLSRPHDESADRIDLRTAVQALGQKLQGRLRDNVQCVVEANSAGLARISSSWLEQLMTNLLLNAEQSIAGPGRIVLRTLQHTYDGAQVMTSGPLPAGTYGVLQVLDTGPGFSEEAERHACEPFFTTRGRDLHDGLGLTVVDGMVRALGGALHVRNADEGAEVSILLPSEDHEATDGPGQDLPASPATGAPPGPVAAPAPPAQAPPPTPSPVTSSPQGSEPAAAPAVSGTSDAARPPSAAGATVPEWKEMTLRQLLAVTEWIVACAAVVSGAFLFRTAVLPMIAVEGAGTCAVLHVARRHPRWPYWVRLSALLGCFWVIGATFTIVLSYLSPVPTAMFFFCVTFAAIAVRRRTAAMVLVATAGVFVLGGVLHQTGLVVAPLESVSPAFARNWFRIAIMLPLAAWAVSEAVLHVLDWARRRVEQLASALHELETTRMRREKEAESLLEAEQMTARVARTEAAGRLTGMVAHDLNNCLQAILGWAELLEDIATTDRGPDAFEAIERSADYAEALIQQLQLGVELPAAGRSLELRAALERMRGMLGVTLARHSAQKMQLLIESEANAFVAIDEQALRRLLFNLTANARDAMPHGGTCRVTVTHTSHHVRLSVEDDGVGMDPETREQILSPFFTTKKDRGTGLGLHSVAEIVERSGGRITVESEVGRGSCFTIEWPLAPAPPPAPAAPPRSALPSARGRVLLVEDNPDVLQVLARGLHQAGYELVTATDGDRAVDIVSAGEPLDALCTDGIMPGCPTSELIQTFTERYPGKPVVLMSGHLPADLEAAALCDSNTTFLRKPFTSRRLVAELGRRLG